MKKVMISLFVLGLMLLTPLSVLAEIQVIPSIPNEPSSSKDTENGMVKTFPIYVELTGDEDNFTDNHFDFTFEFGSAIKEFTCDGYGNFEAKTGGDVSTQGTCTFTNSSQINLGKSQVGTISVRVDKNASDADCTIKYMLGSASSTFNTNNPNTGVSIPYEIIIGGLVLAAGAYIVTSKKTKLYKI